MKQLEEKSFDFVNGYTDKPVPYEGQRIILLSDAEQILKTALEEVEMNIKPTEQKFKENFDLRVRVTKQEVISLIADFTYNNRNFDVTFWSEFDAERLIKAGELIKSQLKGE